MSKKPDFKSKQLEQVAEEKRASRINYESTAFMLKEPYTDRIVKGPLRLSDREAHRRLLDEAKAKGLYVWLAGVERLNGRSQATQLHLIDWDSVPDKPYGTTQKSVGAGDIGAGDVDDYGGPTIPALPPDLVCHKCGQKCNSTSGLTLHLKSHDRNDTVRAAKYPADLRCAVCGHKCFSTSGYTLHMKSHS